VEISQPDILPPVYADQALKNRLFLI